VFGRIAKIPTDGVPHMLFYMSGIVIWNYFSRCLTATSNTFRANAYLFGKVYFPRLTIPISIVISNLFQFLIQFVLLLGFLVYYVILGLKLHITWQIILLPYLIILAALLGLGFGILISSMTTKYRDLMFLLNFGMQLWMYATPIVYPLSEVPKKYQWIAVLNPITPVVEGFRYSLLGVGTVQTWHLIYSFVFMLLILSVGVVVFNKVEQNFMDTV
jgi:lipopolysaccharide transport system permease protein